jgi:hypothetical protein
MVDRANEAGQWKWAIAHWFTKKVTRILVVASRI